MWKLWGLSMCRPCHYEPLWEPPEFTSPIASWKRSLLVMPASLLFGAERIRVLQGWLICQAANTHMHKHTLKEQTSSTIQKHTINKKKPWHKTQESKHDVSTDGNAPFDAHLTRVNDSKPINMRVHKPTLVMLMCKQVKEGFSVIGALSC